MLAKLARTLPVGDYLYEPKWDGFRCLVFRDGDELLLQSRNEKPLNRYFPELVDSLTSQIPERVVLDGEIVIATEDGALDFDLLSLRIHPAESRVELLAETIPANYVVFDLLALDDEDLRGLPFSERRRQLEKILKKSKPPVFLTPATTDPSVAADWFDRFEGAGLDGVVAKANDLTYRSGERVLAKIKHLRTADCVVAGYREHKSGGVGSLLLGLYDDEGVLHHVGVASSFSAPVRKELKAELAPLRDGALDEHPWKEWGNAEAHESARMPGAPSRWNASKDLSWTPLRIDRVAEVAYEHMQGDRFRHTARFQRWRSDKDPAECTYAQLDAVTPAELADLFAS